MCFLSRGLTRAVFSGSRKISDSKEQFTMSRTSRIKLSTTSLKKEVGMALSEQVEDFS